MKEWMRDLYQVEASLKEVSEIAAPGGEADGIA